MSDIVDTFSRRLCAAQAKAGVSVTELSERTGISMSHLSRLRSGKKEPMLRNFVKLCEVLGVTADVLCPVQHQHAPR